MEALRQPENRLKGFLRPAGGASRPTSRANPHRVKRNGRRHGNRTTGHSVYANDNPVRYTDRTGRSVDLDFKSFGAMVDAMEMAVYLAQSPTAMHELNQIVQSGTLYKIKFSQSGGTNYSYERKVVHINTRSGLEVKSSGKIQSPAIGAAHEISHAAENDRIGDAQFRKNSWFDRPITVTPGPPQASPEESRAVKVENQVIKEVGGSAYRKGYYDFVERDVRTCGATSTTEC